MYVLMERLGSSIRFTAYRTVVEALDNFRIHLRIFFDRMYPGTDPARFEDVMRDAIHDEHGLAFYEDGWADPGDGYTLVMKRTENM